MDLKLFCYITQIFYFTKCTDSNQNERIYRLNLKTFARITSIPDIKNAALLNFSKFVKWNQKSFVKTAKQSKLQIYEIESKNFAHKNEDQITELLIDLIEE